MLLFVVHVLAPARSAKAAPIARTEPSCSTLDQVGPPSAPSRACGDSSTPRPEPQPTAAAPSTDSDPAGWPPLFHPAGESACPTCGDTLVVPVGPRDEFGNQDVDDCPTCAIPMNEASRAAGTGREA